MLLGLLDTPTVLMQMQVCPFNVSSQKKYLTNTHFPEEKLFLAHYILINKLSYIDWSHKWCSSEVAFPLGSFKCQLALLGVLVLMSILEIFINCP